MKLLFLTLLMVALAYSKTIRSPLQELKLDRNARAVDGIDPHSGDLHCNDVSTYEPVVWKPKDCKKCTATFPKKSVDKSDKVCIDVPRTQCDIIGYTECTMGMNATKYNVTEMTEKFYHVKECKPRQTTVKHIKKKPVCKPVTKHNCVTKWEVLPDGEKVWSGNDDCTEVTWQDCSLVDIEVDFNITEIVCVNTTMIPWMDCEDTVKEQMTMNMKCVPKAALDCRPVTDTICTTVEWKEFYQEVESNCTATTVQQPWQDVLHKKKCLLANPADHEGLDTAVLKDLQPGDIYDGPISKIISEDKPEIFIEYETEDI